MRAFTGTPEDLVFHDGKYRSSALARKAVEKVRSKTVNGIRIGVHSQLGISISSASENGFIANLLAKRCRERASDSPRETHVFNYLSVQLFFDPLF